jgi:hypothetical protein
MSRRNSLFGRQVLSVPRASCRGGQVADHHGNLCAPITRLIRAFERHNPMTRPQSIWRHMIDVRYAASTATSAAASAAASTISTVSNASTAPTASAASTVSALSVAKACMGIALSPLTCASD